MWAAGFPERLPTAELLRLMNEEDQRVPQAVREALPAVAAAVDVAVERLRAGGRMHYFGTGTSGRIAALDAAELPPTFGISSDRVVAHIAGGPRALLEAIEGAEDQAEQGGADAMDANLSSSDLVVGIAASGETPYVLGAIRKASQAGAFTVGVACVRDSSLAKAVDLAISVAVGPEVVDGSTRLKAGTAQKLVLNMLSTAVFAQLGHVFQGRMVDVHPTNSKLRQRAIGIVEDLAGIDRERAVQALDAAGNRPKLAILMAARNLGLAHAEALLEQSSGDLGKALAATAAAGGG